MDNMINENDSDESGEMIKKVFMQLLALFVIFIAKVIAIENKTKIN